MSSGAWVRLTVPTAKQINAEIKNILNRKAESVTKNPELRRYINTVYRDVVMPFVPMSDKVHHHLKDAYVTNDGRIIWSATNKGYNYAEIQYENLMYKHPIRYGGHNPQALWTNAVQPGTAEWNTFVTTITGEVIRVYGNG